MAKYSKTSPYFSTPQNNINLEPLALRPFAIEDDDQSYTIERTYAYRPDLLAYDMYGTPRLWWVFAQRNPDKIKEKKSKNKQKKKNQLSQQRQH